MHIITWSRCKEFYKEYPDAKKRLKTWKSVVEHSRWANPSQLKEQFRSASMIGDHRTVFNIAGNKYRIIADVRYDLGRVYIRAILTHEEYDLLDVSEL